jgi:hypothetical protein
MGGGLGQMWPKKGRGGRRGFATQCYFPSHGGGLNTRNPPPWIRPWVKVFGWKSLLCENKFGENVLGEFSLGETSLGKIYWVKCHWVYIFGSNVQGSDSVTHKEFLIVRNTCYSRIRILYGKEFLTSYRIATLEPL